MYREIIAVCSQIHTKHTNTLCGQNVELLNFKLVIHIATTGIWRVRNERTWYTHYTDTVHSRNTLQVSITDWTADITADEGQRRTVNTGILNWLDVWRGRWTKWVSGRQSAHCYSHPPTCGKTCDFSCHKQVMISLFVMHWMGLRNAVSRARELLQRQCQCTGPSEEGEACHGVVHANRPRYTSALRGRCNVNALWEVRSVWCGAGLQSLPHRKLQTAFEMWWHTHRNQISSFGETDESI